MASGKTCDWPKATTKVLLNGAHAANEHHTLHIPEQAAKNEQNGFRKLSANSTEQKMSAVNSASKRRH